MKRQRNLLFYIVLLIAMIFLNSHEQTMAQEAMEPFWKNGLGFSSADGKTKFNLGGRLQIDAGFFSEEDGVDVEEDGVKIRRARIALSGLIYGNVEFKTQYDFSGGDADFKDAYIGLLNNGGSGLPDFIKKVRVGQQYEPFGLEVLTSSRVITFAERSFTTNLSPNRNTGVLAIMELFDEPAGSFALGVFQDDDGYGDTQGNDGQAVTGRLSLAPLNEKEGSLVHLGVAFSSRNNPGATVEYDADSLSSLGSDIVSASSASDQVDLLGLEAAFVHGPLSIQSEVVQSSLDNADVNAWYIQGSFFLTGEGRPYKVSSGNFGRVKPFNNFGEDGSGAIEIAVRIMEMDLEEIAPGEMAEAVSLGLNWYLNPNTRVMFNINNSSPADGSTYGNDVTSYVTRFAVNF